MAEEQDIADSLLEEFSGEFEASDDAQDAGEEESSTPEPDEAVEAEAEQEEAEQEAEEAPEPEKPEEPEDDKPWTYHAYKDERDKRQKIEKEAEELRLKLADLEKSEKESRPDVFDDQDGAFQHLESTTDNKLFEQRCEISRDFMSMLKEDYPQREAQFAELAKEAPELAQKLRNHPNPARFAYETAVKAERMKQMENVDEWEAKKEAEIRARVKAEVEAEMSQSEAKESAKREAVTPSLASQKSATGKRKSSSELIDEVFPAHY